MTKAKIFFILIYCVYLLGLFIGCSSFQGPEELEADELSDSLSTHQPYHLLLPQFRSAPFSPHLLEKEGQLPFHNTFNMEWPVDQVHITQKFRPVLNPHHQGIDLGGPLNTSIKAAHEGVVVYAGRGFKGYGKMILIEYNNEWATLYAHLNRFKVKTGQWVSKGQAIGKMGRTGRASGVHLHFELIKDKLPIDPLTILHWPGEIAGYNNTYNLKYFSLLPHSPWFP